MLKFSNFFSKTYETNKGIPYFKVFYNGKWGFPKNPTFQKITSPIDGSLIGMYPIVDEKTADEIIKNLSLQKDVAKNVPFIERAKAMEKAKELLENYKEDMIKSLMINSGKSRQDAEGEVNSTISRLFLTLEEAYKLRGEFVPGDLAKENIGRFAIVKKEPVGLVLAISPFNYPLFISFTKVIPALLAGNVVILKPASANPIPVILMTRILESVGLFSNFFAMITGEGKLGSYMASNDLVNMITFTGSTSVGKELSKIVGIKKVHLELGGKALALVLKDADLEKTANSIIKGSLSNAGQRCDAISGVVAEKEIYDDLVKILKKKIKDVKYGNPFDKDVIVGTMISEKAVQGVEELVNDAIKNGAKLEYGNKIKGCVFSPTLLSNVSPKMKIMNEEIFGPVIPVMKVDNYEEAISFANSLKYGLDMAVFTKDISKAFEISEKIKTGEITINGLPSHGVGLFPFGGTKLSGIGREGIGYSIDEFTETKTIVMA